MDDFLGDDDIGGNMPVLDDSSLRLINEFRQVRFKSISKGFSNYFVHNIA